MFAAERRLDECGIQLAEFRHGQTLLDQVRLCFILLIKFIKMKHNYWNFILIHFNYI